MPSISKGQTFAAGDLVTPTKLNNLVDLATLQFSATDKLAGRSTAGAGAAEDIPCTAAGRALIAGATAADQRTTLGLGSAATQSAAAAQMLHTSYGANNDAITYAAAVALDFGPTIKSVQSITLAGNLTLTTSNLASGRMKVLRIIGDGSLRTLSLPAGWTFLNGSAPTSLAASKTGLLCLFAFGNADSDILATWAVQS